MAKAGEICIDCDQVIRKGLVDMTPIGTEVARHEEVLECWCMNGPRTAEDSAS